MVKMTAEIKRKLKKPWLWALIVVMSAAVWGLGFYWASRVPARYSFFMWVGAPLNINDELSDDIEKICRDSGMKKVDINNCDPNDSGYAAAFALQSNSVDVYILKRSDALEIAQAGVFLDLGEKYKDAERSIEYKDKTIGVRFKEEYYVLICAQSNKDRTLLFKVLDTVAAYGESA